MMSKKIIYSLPVLAVLAFSGCGSSESTQMVDGSKSSNDIVSTGYSVVVERGAVLDANVTDANGSVATQVSDTNNTYIFEDEPVYPITAEGGWIDVDGDGNLTENDVALDINLTSYSDVITPTTTYCADENETVRQERIRELAAEANCTTEDLLSAPSEATRNSIIVLNAVYEKLMERKNNNSKAPLAIGAILERYTEIDNNANLEENATSEEMALAVEEQTMFTLQGKGLIKRLNYEDIENFKKKKPKKIKDDDNEESEESAETEDTLETEEELSTADEKIKGYEKDKGNKGNKDSDDDSNDEDELDDIEDSADEKVSDSDKGKSNKPEKKKKEK